MNTATTDVQLTDWRDHALRLETEVKKVIVGQDAAIRLMNIAIFARGHVLLEVALASVKPPCYKPLHDA